VEKLDEVLRGQPELTRRIQDLDAVILQRAAKSKRSVFTACEAEGWRSRFSCASRRLPASRARGAHLSRTNSNRSLEQRTEISASIYGSWRGGYYSNPREGEIFFREKDWPYR